MFALIYIYSFDDPAVYIFNTEEEAVRTLRETYKEEVRNDTELVDELETSISDDGWKAEIINHRDEPYETPDNGVWFTFVGLWLDT